MSTEVFNFENFQKFSPAPQFEKGLRNVAKSRIVSVFSKPVYTLGTAANNSDFGLSNQGSSPLLQFIVGSSGYMLLWDGYVPKLVFTLTNTTGRDVVVNPMTMFEKAAVFVNNQPMSSHFTNPWAYARDRIMDTPIDKLYRSASETGIPCSGFGNRPFLPCTSKRTLDLLATDAQVSLPGIASDAGDSPLNPGLLRAGASKTYALPLDDICDWLADKDSLPLPLKYCTLRLEFIIRPTKYWSWSLQAANVAAVAPTLTFSSAALRYYRTELPTDLDMTIRGLMERGLLNLHGFACATQALPILFVANGNTVVQCTGLPRSVRFVNQHIEAQQIQSILGCAYPGLVSLDFGISEYQHIADSNVVEDYPIPVKSSCSAFMISEDASYLRKRATKEYTKLSGTCMTAPLYSGIDTNTGAVNYSNQGYYPTCVVPNGGSFNTPPTWFSRLFRMSCNLGSANEDVYSGSEVKTSFNTMLRFGASPNKYFVDTGVAADEADPALAVPITQAQLVSLFYANAETTLGLTSAALSM